MAMVDADGSCHFQQIDFPVDWLGLSFGGHPALSLHSLNEPVKSPLAMALP